MPLVLYQTSGLIATVTLNQPEKLNALDEPVGHALAALFDQIRKDRDIRVVILTGAGRAFSSGGNLEMIEDRTKKARLTNKRELKKFYRVFLGVRDLPIPVIAAINGHAIGAGFCMALACDLRYAATEAKMGANFARIGLAPGMGGTYLITRLAGPTRASEIMMLGETLAAGQALSMGLLNGVFQQESLMSEVKRIAGTIAENGPLPIRMIKRGIQLAEKATLERMFDYDSACQAQTFSTEDIKEGIKAIKEKRAPHFTGR